MWRSNLLCFFGGVLIGHAAVGVFVGPDLYPISLAVIAFAGGAVVIALGLRRAAKKA